jgi:hypothetical protein
MEDRAGTALWLEMTDMPAEAYAADRVPALAAHPGVERVSWWRNVRPGRDDLPRVLPERHLLGIAEVGDGFEPPAAPPGIAALHYRRTPRPGQGRLTGRPTIGLSLVLISPREPHQAQALRDWGDFVHIRHIAEAAVPGYSMITPYEHAEGGDPRYLHLYEIDDADPEAVFGRMTPMVTERIGPPTSAPWRAWATCPELRIMYVNTFSLLGSVPGHPADGPR